MNVNPKNYTLFDYVSVDCKNDFRLGDVVRKLSDNEIGVVIQIHDENDLRTDMFGNECVDNLKLATLEEVKKSRPSLYKDIIKNFIKDLKTIDGEAMQHILEKVAMDEQMHRQLIMTFDIQKTQDLINEKINL
jgi:hypothetical protein